MTTVRGYFLTAIIFHVSLVIGLLCYALKDVDQNALMGLRTPSTMANKGNWRRANTGLGRVMPIVSGFCALLGLGGLWLDALRTGAAFLMLIGIQIAVLIGFATKWWSCSD